MVRGIIEVEHGGASWRGLQLHDVNKVEIM
jgi:hypothetical protein